MTFLSLPASSHPGTGSNITDLQVWRNARGDKRVQGSPPACTGADGFSLHNRPSTGRPLICLWAQASRKVQGPTQAGQVPSQAAPPRQTLSWKPLPTHAQNTHALNLAASVKHPSNGETEVSHSEPRG